MIGNQIQNYNIISLLGDGTMGDVYLAEHQTLKGRVAIKFLKNEFVLNREVRKRFIDEARILYKLSHVNIINVKDLIDAGDIVAFIMEHIEGQTLEDFLITKGKLTFLEIEGLFNQMILAVEYVHEQGLIHRDIKPSNFMVTKSGQIKLLDFGIAKNTNKAPDDYTKTNLAQQMGTPLYMSPEQVRSTAEVTKQTDIYSLGVVLWQMVMNKKPYDSNEYSLPEIQVSIMKEPLPLTNTVWDKKIQEATQKYPENRSFTSKENVNSSDPEIDTEILKPILPSDKKKQKRKGSFNFLTNVISFVVWSLVILAIFYLIKDGNESKGPIPPTPRQDSTYIEPIDTIALKKKDKKKTVSFNKLKIGEKYQGGIIFYLDNSGKHGKVCSERDLGEYDWNSAVDVCRNLNLNGYSDWYLPSKNELDACFYEKLAIGGFEGKYYWSSTEYNATDACYFGCYGGCAYNEGKTNTGTVRGVRAF